MLLNNIQHIKVIHQAVNWINPSSGQFELIVTHADSIGEFKWFVEKHTFYNCHPDEEDDVSNLVFLTDEQIEQINELFTGEQGENNLKAMIQQCSHAKKLISAFYFIGVSQENLDLLLPVAAYADRFKWYANNLISILNSMDALNIDMGYLIKNVQYAEELEDGWAILCNLFNDNILDEKFRRFWEIIKKCPPFSSSLAGAITVLSEANLGDEKFEDLLESVSKDPEFSYHLAQARCELIEAKLTEEKEMLFVKKLENHKKDSPALTNGYINIVKSIFLNDDAKESLQEYLFKYPDKSQWLSDWFVMCAQADYLMNNQENLLREGLRLWPYRHEIQKPMELRLPLMGSYEEKERFKEVINSFKSRESRDLINASITLAKIVNGSPHASVRALPATLAGNIASFFSLGVDIVRTNREDVARRVFSKACAKVVEIISNRDNDAGGNQQKQRRC